MDRYKVGTLICSASLIAEITVAKAKARNWISNWMERKEQKVNCVAYMQKEKYES